MSVCAQSGKQIRFSEDRCFKNTYSVKKKKPKQIMRDARVKYLNKYFETKRLNSDTL